MSRSYQFRAEPRAVAARQRSTNQRAVEVQNAQSKYREESKESLSAANIMNDPRVHRGSNFANKKFQSSQSQTLVLAGHGDSDGFYTESGGLRDQSALPPVYQPSAPLPQPQPPSLTKTKKVTRPLFVRPGTPEPVEGREHFSCQTDPIYEDLRHNPHKFTVTSTQTDSDLDFDTPVMFVPVSHGVDASTDITEYGVGVGIPDFDRDVFSVLQVLVAKCLEESLTEVCEEEEIRELTLYQNQCREKLLVESKKVEKLVLLEKTIREERERRAKEKDFYLKTQAMNKQQREAQSLWQLNEAQLREERVRKAQQEWKDPVKTEVENQFLPWLQSEIKNQLRKEKINYLALDAILRQSLALIEEEKEERKEERESSEFSEYVQARYGGQPVPTPSLVTRVETEMERRELFLSSLSNTSTKESTSHIVTNLERAEMEATARINERTRQLEAKRKYEADIIRIQAVARARRDRRRALKLKQRKELLERRTTMEPNDLLQSLVVDLLMSVSEYRLPPPESEPEFQPVEDEAKTKTESADTEATTLSAAIVVTDASRPVTAIRLRSVTAAPESKTMTATGASRPATTMTSTGPTPAPESGLLIEKVRLYGAASQSGLLAGDIIVAIDGQSIDSAEAYQSLLQSHLPGDVLTLSVYRPFSHRLDTLTVECACTEIDEYSVAKIRELRSDASLKASESVVHTAETALAELEKMGLKMGLTMVKRPKNASGVLVSKLTAGSLAERSGLKDGDAVVKVNLTTVTNTDEWKEATAALLPGELVTLHVETTFIDDSGTTSTGILKKALECGTTGKKNTVEWVRALRSLAKLKYAKIS